MANYFGYCRVSSRTQQRHGTIAEQIKPVTDFLLSHGVAKDQIKKHIYRDTYTGMTMDRPNFNKLMRKVNNGDIIVVYRLDRLSRDGYNAMKFIRDHPNITFHTIRPSMDFSADNKASMRFMNNLMIIFSQFDHDIVMQRFNDGKNRIKAEIKAGKIKPYNYKGGMQKRFYGRKKDHYKAMFNYSMKHSERKTAKYFGCSIRTVARIKASGKKYLAVKAKEQQNHNKEMIKDA